MKLIDYPEYDYEFIIICKRYNYNAYFHIYFVTMPPFSGKRPIVNIDFLILVLEFQNPTYLEHFLHYF